MSPRTPVVAIAVAAVVGLTAVPAAHASYVATAADPAGDAADPARDLTAIGLSYDRRRGELVGAVRFRAAPSEPTRSFLTLFAGQRTASGCNGYPAAGFGSYSDEFGASWLRYDAAGAPAAAKGEADKRDEGTVQRFAIASRQLTGRRYDCVIATLTEAGNPANVFDAVGPLDLAAQPSLAVKLRGVPKVLTPGQRRTITVTVGNDGDAPTGRVRLRLAAARGLTASPRATTIKSVAAGGRRTARIRVSLSRRARSATPLKLTASAGRLKARDEAQLYLRRPSRGGGGGRGPTGSCVRYQADLSGQTGGSLILVPC
ncbi:NEW3 domain-containing protein [Patulibacter defluvii]|uniref:NEW3 domain-containing protein n=1 Tax=Patulibacter defluvii TaxID=3095358 RepID=UPI002A7537F2|nr:NEW3 domain-containing protein [Patulibacter sp. DM4]